MILDTNRLDSSHNEVNLGRVGSARQFAAGGQVTHAGGRMGDAGYGVDQAGGPGGANIPSAYNGGGMGSGMGGMPPSYMPQGQNYGTDGASLGSGPNMYTGDASRGGDPFENLRGNWDQAPGMERFTNGLSPFGQTIGGKGALNLVFDSKQPPRQTLDASGKPVGTAR